MNNGYQKSNGCGADKEGGKIFNTFFYQKLQSKHVRPLATNSLIAEPLYCITANLGRLAKVYCICKLLILLRFTIFLKLFPKKIKIYLVVCET
jgi:hypothetical protein